MVTMSQISSVLQAAKSVSRVLTPDRKRIQQRVIVAPGDELSGRHNSIHTGQIFDDHCLSPAGGQPLCKEARNGIY
jgi:hypothetical protein